MLSSDGLTMHPGLHRPIPDGAWVRTLRERSGCDVLFIYHHTKADKFVLAWWVIKPEVYGQGLAVCQELMTFSAPPDRYPHDLPSMDEVVARCVPAREAVPAMRRKRREYIEREEQLRRASEAQRQDAAKDLRKRGLTEAAFQLDAGAAPYIGSEESGEVGQLIAEDLKDVASDRTISIPGDKSKRPKHRSFG